jgi:hypothetical protein
MIAFAENGQSYALKKTSTPSDFASTSLQPCR